MRGEEDMKFQYALMYCFLFMSFSKICAMNEEVNEKMVTSVLLVMSEPQEGSLQSLVKFDAIISQNEFERKYRDLYATAQCVPREGIRLFFRNPTSLSHVKKTFDGFSGITSISDDESELYAEQNVIEDGKTKRRSLKQWLLRKD